MVPLVWINGERGGFISGGRLANLRRLQAKRGEGDFVGDVKFELLFVDFRIIALVREIDRWKILFFFK